MFFNSEKFCRVFVKVVQHQLHPAVVLKSRTIAICFVPGEVIQNSELWKEGSGSSSGIDPRKKTAICYIAVDRRAVEVLPILGSHLSHLIVSINGRSNPWTWLAAIHQHHLTGALLQWHLQQQQAYLLRRLIPLRDKLIEQFRQKRHQWPAGRDPGKDLSSNGLVRLSLLLSLGAILGDVIDNRLHACARSSIGVGHPAETYRAVVVVENGVIASTVTDAVLRIQVSHQFGRVVGWSREVEATELLFRESPVWELLPPQTIQIRTVISL